MTFREKVEHCFRDHPNEWVNAQELMRIGGMFAWRSRVSNCRVQLGMSIENRLRYEHDITISEYRYLPPQPAAQPSLFQEAVT